MAGRKLMTSYAVRQGRYCKGVQNRPFLFAFVQENSEELGWVERTVLAGDKVCGKANDELNECLGRFIEVSKKKAQELGLQ